MVRARRPHEVSEALAVVDLLFGGREAPLRGGREAWAVGEGPGCSENRGLALAADGGVSFPGCLSLAFQLGALARPGHVPRFPPGAAQTVDVDAVLGARDLAGVVAAYGGHFARLRADAPDVSIPSAVRDAVTEDLACAVVRETLGALQAWWNSEEADDEEANVHAEALETAEALFATRWPAIAGYLRAMYMAAAASRRLAFEGDPQLPSHISPRLLPGHGAVRAGSRVGRFVVGDAFDVVGDDGEPATEYVVDWGASYGPDEREPGDPEPEDPEPETVLGFPPGYRPTRKEVLLAVNKMHPDRGGSADMDAVRRAKSALLRGKT